MRAFVLILSLFLASALVRAADEAALPAVVDSLQSIELVEGDGVEALRGRTAVVHYTGWLYDPAAEDGKGRKFDSSVDRGRPFSFEVGAGRVIRGWDAGVVGMSKGGKRRLIIPSDMAYGKRGAGGVIPPNATLLFDVELVDVE